MEMKIVNQIMWLRLGCQAAGVLKNALGAGVMDELLSPNQPLGHEYFAPGAETIR